MFIHAALPLLPQRATQLKTCSIIQMLVGLNGEERTLGTFIELTAEAGWKIVEVFTISGSYEKQILAVPV